MAFDWKKVIGGVAPALAQSLVPGGSFAKAALQYVGKALLGRDDASESEVQEAIKNGATTEQLQALVTAENDYKLGMEKLGVDVLRLEVEDRANARSRQIALHDWVPSALGALIVGGFLAMATAVLTGHVPMRDAATIGVVGTVIGYVSAKADTVVGFYFGSSLGSRLKDQQPNQ